MSASVSVDLCFVFPCPSFSLLSFLRHCVFNTDIVVQLPRHGSVYQHVNFNFRFLQSGLYCFLLIGPRYLKNSSARFKFESPDCLLLYLRNGMFAIHMLLCERRMLSMGLLFCSLYNTTLKVLISALLIQAAAYRYILKSSLLIIMELM